MRQGRDWHRQPDRPGASRPVTGASDGRRKVDALAFNAAPGLPVLEAFDAETLGAALGRSGVVHLVLAEGPEARRITVLAASWRVFCPPAKTGIAVPGAADAREGTRGVETAGKAASLAGLSPELGDGQGSQGVAAHSRQECL